MPTPVTQQQQPPQRRSVQPIVGLGHLPLAVLVLVLVLHQVAQLQHAAAAGEVTAVSAAPVQVIDVWSPTVVTVAAYSRDDLWLLTRTAVFNSTNVVYPSSGACCA